MRGFQRLIYAVYFLRNFPALLLMILFLNLISGTNSAQNINDTEPFTFIQITDIQFGMFEENDGFKKETVLYTLAIEQINKLKPDFVVITGDFVHSSRSEAQMNEFKRITSQIDSDIPVYLIPGNHDTGQDPDEGSIQRFIGNYGYDRFSFIHKNTLFIGLNGSIIKENLPVLEQLQYEWLEEILQSNSQNLNNIIIFNHYPFFLKTYSEPENYMNLSPEMRDRYFTLFSKYGVDFVFTGHQHKNAINDYEGITQVTTSAIGKQLGEDYYGFRIIDIDANGIIHSYQGLNEAIQDSIHVSLVEWTFDKWYGGGILPPDRTVDTPIPADRGTSVTTALLGTEQMFSGGDVTRIWSVPTTGGYIRCSNGWAPGGPERYYMITGINTQNTSSIRLTSSHATSSSSQPYSLVVQYRLTSDGSWKDLFGPFSVTSVSESGISFKQVNEIWLPAECANVKNLNIRWLCTSFPPSATTQFRIDNILLTANVANPEPGADKTAFIDALLLSEKDWAVPSWTLLLSARKKAELAPIASNLNALSEVMNNMLTKEMPFNIIASFNGDPARNMGFAWYTNRGETGGKVQIVNRENATLNDFKDPLMTINSTVTELRDVNYLVKANDPTYTSDLQVNSKRSYSVNKVKATGLTPGTKYSYRVGNDDEWSSIRNFQTADKIKNDFSFIYITDTQASSNDNFDVSSSTLSEAYRLADDPLFILMTGDLVESQGSLNSEWEYEQFFERMQNVWSKIPLVATIGNHDVSSSNNFFHHINNENSYNQTSLVKTSMNGTVYSFVVGDALFMVVNHEDRTKPGFNESLGNWMTEQVNVNPEVRWRIVAVHTGLFSGGAHMDDPTIADLRDDLMPYYNELKIDLSIQGHDHVYNAIGPVDNLNKTLVPGAVSNVVSVPIDAISNMNGKTGGTFDVSDGTFYFINNAASRKKYSPQTEQNMNLDASITRVPDYWSLFTGQFGQTGEPTFSILRVTSDTIFIDTYAINHAGTTYLLDQIKIIKEVAVHTDQIKWREPEVKVIYNNSRLKVTGLEARRLALYSMNGQLINIIENANNMETGYLKNGIYIISALYEGGVYNQKIIL